MPAHYDFPPIPRGDTRTLAVFLRRRSVLTLEKEPVPFAGATVEWTLMPPGQQSKTYTGGDGLDLDPATGGVRLPLASDFTSDAPAKVPYRLRVKDAAGGVKTYLTGIVPFEG